MRLTSFLLALLFTFQVLADCDFKTGISPNQDGSYRYVKECHILVGQMKAKLESTDQATQDLLKAIQLKDQALKTADERTQLWMDAALKLEKREESIENLRKQNDWMYFALGALTVFGSGVMAAQLSHGK